MIFGRKHTQQMKDMVEEVLAEALRQQSRELDAQQSGQVRQLNDMMEKNQKAVRGLSDTVEDFLDTLQEENAERERLGQEYAKAKEREQGLLRLLELYQEQTELFEQWLSAQNQENSDAALEAWKQQQVILKGKLAAESRLCAIERTGLAGELVDYRIHEVLQAVGPDTKEQEGTVAKVYSQGMLYQGTVIRKARVAAYRKE
ncbi:MAG: nucleotide exchange factor GrpE [Lachnospiraceae bacterium]|nr:nucleotide exchange factor GrpE [Lachnospiraceae bacterium]